MIALIAVALGSGCGPSESTSVKQFKKAQQATILHTVQLRRILVETPEGTIAYDTTDGSHWGSATQRRTRRLAQVRRSQAKNKIGHDFQHDVAVTGINLVAKLI